MKNRRKYRMFWYGHTDVLVLLRFLYCPQLLHYMDGQTEFYRKASLLMILIFVWEIQILHVYIIISNIDDLILWELIKRKSSYFQYFLSSELQYFGRLIPKIEIVLDVSYHLIFLLKVLLYNKYRILFDLKRQFI